MKTISTQMTVRDLSVILNICEETVIKLAKTGQLPCFHLNDRMYFILDEIIGYFKKLEGSAA